jgi:L-asparagine transporter-like permease
VDSINPRLTLVVVIMFNNYLGDIFSYFRKYIIRYIELKLFDELNTLPSFVKIYRLYLLLFLAIGLVANKYSNKHRHREGEVWRPGIISGHPHKMSSQPKTTRL